jgi:hypothetical protein
METKPSWQTTEFWLTIFSNVGNLVNLFGWWNYVPNSWSVAATAIITALYSVSRGQAKSGVPYTPPSPGP